MKGLWVTTGCPRLPPASIASSDPEYYLGHVPVFDPAIFNTTREAYEYGWPEEEPVVGAFTYPVREAE